MQDAEFRGDRTGNAPFAANFFIAPEKTVCGSNDIKVNDLVS
jgi:hypothetical protein